MNPFPVPDFADTLTATFEEREAFMRLIATVVMMGTAAAVLAASPASAVSKLDTLYSFCPNSGCTDGDQPYGGVTLLPHGQLIGTTGFGGKYNGGTVFDLAEKKGTLSTLANFCVGTPPNCQSYQGPITTLVEDTSGNIYGTTYFGGANNDGGVYELIAKPHHKYKLKYIYSFNGSDGSGPWELTYAGQSGGALYDGKSPLYSTTIAGGLNGAGIVFSLTPGGGGWQFQDLYDFCSAANCSDGGLPYAGVIIDSSGNLFGTTGYYGNSSDGGTIFELTNTTFEEKTLYTFCSASGCTDGSGPLAGVAEDAKGNLYGTTYFAGAQGYGVLFELSANGSYSVLHQFCSQTNCTDGSRPAAGVTLDSSGNVFGIAGRGGDANVGVIFEMANGNYKRLYSFCSVSGCSDGEYPYGTFALDSKGRLYGTTQAGGGHGLGEVYRVKP